MLKKILLLVVFIFVSALSADYVVKYDMSGDKVDYLYKNSEKSKMITTSKDGDKSEIYHMNKNSYIVTYSREGVKVVDMNEMKAKLKSVGFNPKAFMQNQEKPKYTIKKTSKKVTVGGITGREWIVDGSYNGEKFKETIVVTNNKNVVKAMRGMYKGISDITNGMTDGYNFFEVEKGYVTIKATDMKLLSFKKKSIASSEFVLPKSSKKNLSEPRQRQKHKPKNMDADIDKAADMLKSFF